jgi:hypothetical protein
MQRQDISRLAATTCLVPGCSCGLEQDRHALGPEAICQAHFRLASQPTRGLLLNSWKRLERLERCWANDQMFEQIRSRGRYLQFCAVLEAAHAHLNWAWEHLKQEIFAALTCESDEARVAPSGPAVCQAAPAGGVVATAFARPG